MEVEYSGGGVLIFSYLILYTNLITLGVFCDNFGSDFMGCHFDGRQLRATGFARSKLSRGSLIRVNSLAAALIARL